MYSQPSLIRSTLIKHFVTISWTLPLLSNVKRPCLVTLQITHKYSALFLVKLSGIDCIEYYD